MEAISVKNLSVAYENNTIIEDLSLSIPKGKISIIIGANGCGKSTFLKTLARINKPKAGEIFINKKDIKKINEKNIAKEVAFLPQGPVCPSGLTVRELVRMIKSAGIDLENLEEENFDSPLGYSTGAADIFGVTGGVLEAALRTAYTFVTKEELADDAIEFKAVRGFDGIKEATINVAGTDVNVVAASSLGCARKLMDELRDDIKSGRKPKYDIIEIMACPGGCVNGGGQPFTNGDYEKVKAIHYR